MTGVYIEQPFVYHLADAVRLLELAELLPSLAGSRHSALARASVMASTLAVEAAANSFMLPIEFPKHLTKLIDQGKALDKFEFVLRAVQPNKRLDRGGIHVQQIAELFGLRNRFVHPRTRRTEISHRELGEGRFSIRKTDDPTVHLRVPPSPEDWNSTHAKKVLEAVTNFLDYLVLDLFEMEQSEFLPILLSHLEVGGRSGSHLPPPYGRSLARVQASCRSRLIEAILGEFDREEKAGASGTTTLLFLYSWRRGVVGGHQWEKTIELTASRVTSRSVARGLQEFLLWFEEAEFRANGRVLTNVEAWSEKRTERFLRLDTYVSDWGEPGHPAEDTRIGRIEGAQRQLFVNGVYGAELRGTTAVAVISTEKDQARELSVPVREIATLHRGVRVNLRTEWEAGELLADQPEAIETKGRDFKVEKFAFVGLFPGSNTVFVSYKAESGRTIQLDLSPSTLLALEAALSKASRGR